MVYKSSTETLYLATTSRDVNMPKYI